MEIPPEKQSYRGLRYIPTLDGWRAIAVCMVMLSHFGKWAIFKQTPALRFILAKGNLGVDVFFTLSGFLITSTLIQDFQEFGRVQVRDFYLRRFFRIIPPILPYLGCLLLLGTMGQLEVSLAELRASLLFYRNLVEGGWTTGHFWSLAVEEHFYILWPFLFSFLYSRTRKATPLLVAVALLAAWRVLAIDLDLAGDFRTDVNFVGLAWGGALAVLFQSEVFREKLTRLFKGYRCIPLIVFIVASTWARFPLGKATFILALPLLILSKVSPQTRWSLILESGPFRWLGKRSYSIYLWQQLATFYGIFVALKYPVFDLFFAVAVVLLVSAFSYSYIETPSIRLGRRLIARLRRSPIRSENKQAA